MSSKRIISATIDSHSIIMCCTDAPWGLLFNYTYCCSCCHFLFCLASTLDSQRSTSVQHVNEIPLFILGAYGQRTVDVYVKDSEFDGVNSKIGRPSTKSIHAENEGKRK